MNEATIKITGVGASFLPVLTFLIILLSLKWREKYTGVFAKGSVADSPPLRHKEGKLTDVLFKSVYKDDQGNVLGIVIVIRYNRPKKSETELIEAKVFAELATGIAEEEK
jgi:hypothetical protein